MKNFIKTLYEKLISQYKLDEVNYFVDLMGH